MNRLQTRLLISFLIVMMVTLCITGTVWAFVLRSRPVPVEGLVNELTATLLDMNFIEDWQAFRQQRGQISRLQADEFAQIIQSKQIDERVILLRGGGIVLYDSAGHFQPGDSLRIEPYHSQFETPRQRLNIFIGAGIFKDKNEEEWVFASQRFTPGNAPNSRLILELMIVASRPKPTLRYLLDAYGGTFLLPLCQAGAIGMMVAMGLSFWVSRSVAKPLKAIATASNEVALGNYDRKVPVNGPAEAQMVARAFNNMTAQVKNTRQSQSDFLANIAHDLRTPLTSIQGFSQSIIDEINKEPEDVKRAAHIIYDEANRMGRLVTDLMDIAKIQAGRMHMMSQAVELDRVLEQVGSSFMLRAQEKDITLHVDIPSLFRIAGDGDRLVQAFTNLVDNAIKHTNEGGQVWLRAQPQQNGVQVQVQDTGEGIPHADLPHIFERFYQVDKSRNRAKQGGFGLGLPITYEIITAHNGHIHVDSQVDVGTTFAVWLPAISDKRRTSNYPAVSN